MLAFTPITQYKGRSPPTTEAPGHQQVAIVIITPPLQVSSILVLIIIANMDTGIANMDNSHGHSHGHNNREGVVEVGRVVKPKKGRGERTQKG